MRREGTASASLALGEARPGPGVHRFTHAAMATVFEVHCAHDDVGYARRAAHAAFDLVDRLEQAMSRFIANSDVSRINNLMAGQTTRVSPSTLECLEIARHLFYRTGGTFDISIGSGLDGLDLVPDDFAVHARTDGIRLDLGGIAKGYAVDRMAELLREWGIEHALIHGGFSSVLALQPPPDRDGWALTLSSPWPGDQRVLARILARQKALSASGTRKGDHIVDPTNGRPARGRAAWAAIAVTERPDELPVDIVKVDPGRSPAAVAEGLSTAFMVLPTRGIEGLCRSWPGLEAWLSPEPAPGEEPEATFLHLPASPRDEDHHRDGPITGPRREHAT